MTLSRIENENIGLLNKYSDSLDKKTNNAQKHIALKKYTSNYDSPVKINK